MYCFLVLFALQTIELSEFSTSQKWPPSYHSVQCLMNNTGSLKGFRVLFYFLVHVQAMTQAMDH